MTKGQIAISVAKITAVGAVLAALIAAIPNIISALSPKAGQKIYIRVVPQNPNVKVVPELHAETTASDVETLRDISMWDLRGWKAVAAGETNLRVSPANYINYLHVKKLKDVGVYRAHYSTNGSAIDIRCITHPAEILTEEKSSNHPGEGKKEYEVDVDVSTIPVNHEFLIVVEATYWNSFQNPTGEEASTYTDEDMHQMDELAMFVLLPDGKPFKSVQRWERPSKSSEKAPYHSNERLYQDDSGRFVYWSISDRKPDHHYQITWTW